LQQIVIDASSGSRSTRSSARWTIRVFDQRLALVEHGAPPQEKARAFATCCARWTPHWPS
jgi:hypothetical protein